MTRAVSHVCNRHRRHAHARPIMKKDRTRDTTHATASWEIDASRPLATVEKEEKRGGTGRGILTLLISLFLLQCWVSYCVSFFIAFSVD